MFTRVNARGLLLALCVGGFVPALIAGAAVSCDAVLDAAPWLFAALCGAGAIRLWRWSEC